MYKTILRTKPTKWQMFKYKNEKQACGYDWDNPHIRRGKNYTSNLSDISMTATFIAK